MRQESVVYSLAQQCREDLEDTKRNADIHVFPAEYFPSIRGRFYGAVVFERPLRTGREAALASRSKSVTYRFIWMRSFHDQVSIIMNVQPGGSGQLRLQALGRIPRKLESRTESLSKEQVQGVLALIEKAEFWNMETEGGPHGNDGAEWVWRGYRPVSTTLLRAGMRATRSSGKLYWRCSDYQTIRRTRFIDLKELPAKSRITAYSEVIHQ